MLMDRLKHPFPRTDRETFWALKNLTLDIKRGDVVGIIGRNGAGKSTLLKILSRITHPTTGQVDLYGNVASLLEIGTGFHPELTGRENIYLNGAILGMGRREIAQQFDAIVGFAEVEQFLDTPVKRYSSGMYVRLAFAVAAHLNPDILLVDEVLAVGDAAFQKKCLGKMQDVSRQEGRTVLFVSHNMAAVSALCTKAMVLRKGSIEYPPGDVSKAIQTYLMQVNRTTRTPLSEREDRQGEGGIRIVNFAVYNIEGEELEFVISGQEVEFRIYYESAQVTNLKNVIAAIGITSHTGAYVTMLCNQIASVPFDSIQPRGVISCRIKKLPFAPGGYTLNLIIRQGDNIQDWIQEAAVLTVEDGDFFNTGRMPPPTHGGVLVEQVWSATRNYSHSSKSNYLSAHVKNELL
jgi:lipopolysaccharide transport system ATP-binding protein